MKGVEADQFYREDKCLLSPVQCSAAFPRLPCLEPIPLLSRSVISIGDHAMIQIKDPSTGRNSRSDHELALRVSAA